MSPFCIEYFWDRVSLYDWCQLGPWSSYVCFCSSWDDRHTTPHLAIGLNGGLKNFLSRLAWTVKLLPMSSHVAGTKGKHHHTWLVCWDVDLINFCSWLQNTNFLISASQVAGIIAMNHHIQPKIIMLWSLVERKQVSISRSTNYYTKILDFPSLVF
jgi:hypothetical protein